MIRIGMMLYGYCNGYFGRDSYDDKRVEAFGFDWIVARDDFGRIHFASFDGGLPDEMIATWAVKGNDR